MGFFAYIGSVLNHPRTALLIMLLFLVGYLIFANYGGAFKGKFLRFGPDVDSPEDGQTSFMGIKLDNWKNVIAVYFIMFFVTILKTYYSSVVSHSIEMYVLNTLVELVPFPKFWTYLISIVDPFIKVLLHILDFYAVATFELQYIIPKFIGEYIVDLPYVLSMLKHKKFIS